ncbi:MAG: LptF/LptG family permease [Rhodothermales bacterium]|nr:LptF/LptG family permease [Rhodothermales bacterium]MBO6779842.1 LptF/LptG family permease [Rhodothermales bacterium]
MSKPIKTFDLLIFRRLSITYVVLMVALIIFFIVLHYVEYVDDFIDRGATMSEVFSIYYPNYVPEIVRLMSPLALFLSTLFLTGRMAQKLELAALQTSGVSLYRILVPFAVVGVLVTGTMFWFNGWVVPESNRVRIRFEKQYTKAQSSVDEYNNIHRQNSPGSVITVNFYDRATQTAHTVTMQRFGEGRRLEERVDARSMQWIEERQTWLMRSPIVRTFHPDGSESLQSLAEMDTTLALLPRDMARTDGDVESMTITEARDYISVLERSGAGNLGLPRVTYYVKYAYPFANLILVLLAVPLAAPRRRKGQALVMGGGLFVAFVYLALMKFLEPFGYEGTLSPQAAAWIPHAAFFVAGILVIWRARK